MTPTLRTLVGLGGAVPASQWVSGTLGSTRALPVPCGAVHVLACDRTRIAGLPERSRAAVQSVLARKPRTRLLVVVLDWESLSPKNVVTP